MIAPLSLTIAHSPDPDDAFMFYALVRGKIETGPFHFSHVLQDIETLNRAAFSGTYELTALSFHAYPYVADRYILLTCGSSMGARYGPILVARENISVADLKRVRIAVPGTLTTAFLLLHLVEPEIQFVVVPFDQILEEVSRGRADVGLIIHEGQLTYSSLGLRKILDLGQWWEDQTHLPLPLGGNAVRRDLGESVIHHISRLLRQSIEYALTHRDDALTYALQYGRGLSRELADRFVGMYVNALTLDCGASGKKAIETLFQMAYARGLIPAPCSPQFVE